MSGQFLTHLNKPTHMSIENFGTEKLKSPSQKPQVQSMIEQVKNAESWAIAITRFIKKQSYVTPEELEEWVLKQNIPAASPAIVVAFLAGFVSGETWRSRFDKEVFGEDISTDFQVKGVISLASLKALVSVLDKVTELQPNVIKIEDSKDKRRKGGA